MYSYTYPSTCCLFTTYSVNTGLHSPTHEGVFSQKKVGSDQKKPVEEIKLNVPAAVNYVLVLMLTRITGKTGPLPQNGRFISRVFLEYFHTMESISILCNWKKLLIGFSNLFLQDFQNISILWKMFNFSSGILSLTSS